MKTCFKCKLLKEFYSYGSYCKDCYRARRLKYSKTRQGILSLRRSGKKFRKSFKGKISAAKATDLARKRNPDKYRARYLLNNALARNKIKKNSCTKCNNINSEAHHPDYSKPLNVIWLCRVHHLVEHNNYTYV